jgi:hypothetical protein
MFFRLHRSRCMLIAGGFVCLLLAASCSPFSPREAEEPVGEASDYVEPQDPWDVISNLRNSIETQSDLNYERLFAEDFVFVPDQSDVNDLESIYYPGVYDDWDAETERQVGRRLLDESLTSHPALSLGEGEVAEDTDSTYVVQHDYELGLFRGRYKFYMGTAIFRLSLNPGDGLWYIRQWEDSRSEAGQAADRDTWGKLKGEIRATS